MSTNRLKLVYNGNETIMDAGFTMQSNYILPVLSRMVDEKILNFSAQTVVQTILSYKHTEANPFPSRDEIALRLGKSVSYVKKALKAITDAGILAIEKVGRKNTYNFAPLFSIVEGFIKEFVHNKNTDVSITDLLDVVKTIESNNDFSWTSKTNKPEKKQVNKEVSKEAEKTVTPTLYASLPDKIVVLLESNNVSKEGIDAVVQKYNHYKDSLDEKVFLDKITASAGKKNFVAFFNKCIDNAYINDEQPKEVPSGKYSRYNNTPVSNEVIPEWFEEQKKNKKIKTEEEKQAEVDEITGKNRKKDDFPTNAEVFANATREELHEMKEVSVLLNKYSDGKNKDAIRQIKAIDARLENMNLGAKELDDIMDSAI